MTRAPVMRASRHLLAAALLALLGLVATSCVSALDLGGYSDGYLQVCKMVARCYGDAYDDCEGRVQDADASRRETFLERLGSGCLDSCRTLLLCLDPMCTAEVGKACALNEDCCGYSSGATACEYGACCAPLGAACTEDGDCCPNTGFCDQETHTCGGVVCGSNGVACLNDFQCCSGRCEAGACSEIPCSQEGFECTTDADCCEQSCVSGKCRKPMCVLSGDPCTADEDCCPGAPVCWPGPGGGDNGICSTGPCNPTNDDCTGDASCCTGYCHPTYHLCGKCAAKGEACGNASPCCDGLDACNGDTCE